MPRLPSTLGFLFGLILLLVVTPLTSAQADRSVTWERFDLAIEVLPDSTLRITQVEQIRFDGTFQRAYREIPIERLSSITEVQVGEPGQPYRSGFNQPRAFAVSRTDDAVRIDWWFPPTTNAVRTFEIRYRVVGAIRIYPAGDQLWWVAVPAELPGKVLASDVSVRLPEAVPPEQLRAAGYVGGQAAPADSISSGEVRFSARDLPVGEPFEVRVQFPHGIVTGAAPVWQADFDRKAAYDSSIRPVLNLLLLLLSLGLAVGGVMLLVLRWYTQGRDPAGGVQIAEAASPPSDLPPGVAGTVVDEQADLQDVLATLIDLASRGIIRITEQHDPTLRGSSLDYRLELPQKQPLGLRSFERTVIGALFGADDEVRLSRVKPRWEANVPIFAGQLYDEAVGRGLFVANPDRVRRDARRLGALLLGAAVVGGFFALAVAGGAAELIWLPFVALAVVGLAALLLARQMPRRTKAGVVEAARWRAFGRYLASSHAPASETEVEQFGRYLPYAIALGVDHTWLENFRAIGTPAPRWYGGTGPVIVGGPGGWGYPGGYYGPLPRQRRADGGGGEAGLGPDTVESGRLGGGAAGGIDDGSGSLADLLNAASEALSSGGWGGGGGWSGGGSVGGGGSGGGRAGFG